MTNPDAIKFYIINLSLVYVASFSAWFINIDIKFTYSCKCDQNDEALWKVTVLHPYLGLSQVSYYTKH